MEWNYSFGFMEFDGKIRLAKVSCTLKDTPQERIRVQTKDNPNTRVFFQVQTRDGKHTERLLHNLLHAFHAYGEWFNVTPQVESFFKALHQIGKVIDDVTLIKLAYEHLR